MTTITRTRASDSFIESNNNSTRSNRTTRTRVSGSFIEPSWNSYSNTCYGRNVRYVSPYISRPTYGDSTCNQDTTLYKRRTSDESDRAAGFFIAAVITIGFIALFALAKPSQCHYEKVCNPLLGDPYNNICHWDRVCESII